MAAGARSSGIAIIGSGVAGLHLPLLLPQRRIPTPERTTAFLARHGM